MKKRKLRVLVVILSLAASALASRLPRLTAIGG